MHPNLEVFGGSHGILPRTSLDGGQKSQRQKPPWHRLGTAQVIQSLRFPSPP